MQSRQCRNRALGPALSIKMDKHRMSDSPAPDELHQRIVDLEAREEHLRLAQEAGEIGTWEWEFGTGEMRWSAQMCRNLGLVPPATGASRHSLIAAIHPDDRAHTEAALTEFQGRSGPMRIEARVVWPGDDVHWIVFLGRTEADTAGNPVRIRGITIDGTRRR